MQLPEELSHSRSPDFWMGGALQLREDCGGLLRAGSVAHFASDRFRPPTSFHGSCARTWRQTSSDGRSLGRKSVWAGVSRERFVSAQFSRCNLAPVATRAFEIDPILLHLFIHSLIYLYVCMCENHTTAVGVSWFSLFTMWELQIELRPSLGSTCPCYTESLALKLYFNILLID